MFKKLLHITIILLLTLNCNLAEEKENITKDKKPSFYTRTKKSFSEIWHSNMYDLYIPINTWHNRFAYDERKIDAYNERPWGFGFGKTFIDEKRNVQQLYVIKFQDSHNRTEPMFGYNYKWQWYLDKKEHFVFGVGLTAGLTMREEYDYVPLPLVLPLVSISYGVFAIESVYIPGGYNGGNVLFTWLRFTFKFGNIK